MGATESLEAVLLADAGGLMEHPLAAALIQAIGELSTAAISLSAALAAPDGFSAGQPDPEGRSPGGGAHSDAHRLDRTAADLFAAAAERSSVGCYLAQGPGGAAPRRLRREGLLDLAAAPLEGASDLDVGAPAGTLFSFFAARAEPASAPEAAFLRPGRDQIAAGLFIYGPQTGLLVTVGAGAHLFHLHRESATYVLVRSPIILPMDETDHQDAPSPAWENAASAGLTADPAPVEGGPAPWVASFACESYRVLIRGGLVVRAAGPRGDDPHERLPLVTEANAVALLARQAGGAASDGLQPILDVVAETPDQRTAFLMGLAERVERLRRHSLGSAPFAPRPPLFGRRGLLRT